MSNSRILAISLSLLAILFLSACAADYRATSVAEVGAVLDQLHTAASDAEEQDYFAVYAPSAIFIGTDGAERWTLNEFRQYAAPVFAEGRGWTYTPTDRHIYISPGGDTAWFDEMLHNEKYGECRGTGVLIRHAGGWKLTQYHLTVPVPNDLLPEVVDQIRAIDDGQDPAHNE